MRQWVSWMEAVGPGRILNGTIAVSILVSALFAAGQFQDRLEAEREAIRRQLDERAAGLDARLTAAASLVESLRNRALFHLAEHPDPARPAAGPLLDAFLQSNPNDEAGRPFSLDRLPPPYTQVMVGNLVALPTAAARRREGLQRPDLELWRQEAAMALSLNPLLAVAQRAVPGAGRAYYASASGMALFFPWQASASTDLLETYPRRAAYRMALPQANPQRAVYWTEPQAQPDGGAMVTVGAPLDHGSRFLGMLALELPLAPLAAELGASPLPGGTLALVNDHDQLLVHPALAAVTADGAVRRLAEALPAGVAPADLKGAGSAPAVRGDHYLAVRPLSAAPWRLVLTVPEGAMLLPVARETALALAGPLLTLLFALGLGTLVVRRILRQREEAVTAERGARAEAERALADLRAAHDELDFLNREKTRFFSLVSHDLRGPFNVLLGMTDELAQHGSRMRPADVADFASTVHESARTVHELLENLLHWSRVQMSGTPFAPSVIALHEVVTGAVRDVTPSAEAKSIKILDAVGDRHILADRTMILAVLRNLLMNAIKFSHPGGVVHITSRALGDRLELAVTDHGVGIDSGKVALLFRASGTSQPGTRGETGTGLGLTLVRDLVLRHGGDLQVDSEPGKGTTVSFSVPLAAPPAPAAERRRVGAAAD